MATRNKRKLAALNKENCEEHPRCNGIQNSNVPRSQEDYISQVSEEIEGRVTKKLSQEFSRTENRILGAPARLDDFLMNPLLQGHSGTTPETPRTCLVKTRERMMMTPRVTLILKRASPPLAEKIVTTWRRESKERVQLVRTHTDRKITRLDSITRHILMLFDVWRLSILRKISFQATFQGKDFGQKAQYTRSFE